MFNLRFLFKDKKVTNSKNKFRRIEQKFILSKSYLPNFMDILNNNMDRGYLREDTTHTLIESTYFDANNLNFFQDHFKKLDIRFKVRVRRYAPNGIWEEGPALLEVKYKELGVSKKYRISIGNKDLNQIMAGELLSQSPALSKLNENMNQAELNDFISFYNDLSSKYKPLPVLKIKYKRFAFEKDDFRVTVDHALDYECMLPKQHLKSLVSAFAGHSILDNAYEMSKKYAEGEVFLVEMKHRGTIPDWMNNFILAYDMDTDISFSKYCWAIGKVFKKQVYGFATGLYPKQIRENTYGHGTIN